MRSFDMSGSPSGLRLLVAIASYGRKNTEFLKSIIQAYKRMELWVEVIVLSEAPKELGSGAKLVVGLPARNPWTLPFAHKKVLAENVDRYDLFAYSEDDIEVTQHNIQAFLEATPALHHDEIAGFLRYETKGATKLLTDVHKSFHWEPGSVRRRGALTVAEFTNEHAGFYLLTQDQLRRAIASGGFLRAPCEGRYGLPETAATDPYTTCGFRKVICISALEDFLVRHMSNAYINQYGVCLSDFKEQIETLMAIQHGTHPAATLCSAEPKVLPRDFYKSYYETSGDEVMALIPSKAMTILSVGCGWGATETRLQRQGARVTAIPLDSVIGAAAARFGIEVLYGAWKDCQTQLGQRQFDCVLISNLLHLQPDPGQFLKECARYVGEKAALVVNGYNFSRLPTWSRRVCRLAHHGKLRRFEQSGISVCGPASLSSAARAAGLTVTAVKWFNHRPLTRKLGSLRLGSLTANDWVLQARR
jgi:hypothetical protein